VQSLARGQKQLDEDSYFRGVFGDDGGHSSIGIKPLKPYVKNFNSK
jgi:hypothetical protein